MAAASGMAVSDMPLRMKLEYESFMNGQTSYVSYGGKIYNSQTQEDTINSAISMSLDKQLEKPLLSPNIGNQSVLLVDE